MPASERAPAGRGTSPSASSAHRQVRLEWTIASEIVQIEGIVASVREACIAAGFAQRHCNVNVPVALTEALANAIVCGNGGEPSRRVHILASVSAQALEVDITDEGSGFDVEAARRQCEADDWLEREDGRGVFLMHALMDRVETRRHAGHTVRLVLART